MKRNSRRPRSYQGYQGNRRRRGSPLPLLLVLVLLAGAGYLVYRHFSAPAPEPSGLSLPDALSARPNPPDPLFPRRTRSRGRSRDRRNLGPGLWRSI